MHYGAVTDIGRVRKINEDSYHVSMGGIFPYVVVADGMGGHQAGEVASMMVVDILKNHLESYLDESMDYVEVGEVIRRAFISANNIVFNYSKNHYKIMGMGTTATLAMIYGGKIITAHVGDSRAYRVGVHSISQITRDHSYVQELVLMGRMTPEEAKHNIKRNYITRAMGAEETVKVDIKIYPYNGEKILVCSDGLTNYVEDDEIMDFVNNADDLQCAAQEMTQLANVRGGRDNITVAIFGE